MHRPLVLGAFEEFTPNFIANTWHHPQADTAGFASLASWQDLAGRLDDAGFDFLFFADAVGYPMDDAGVVPPAVVREAVQFPVHDPLVLIAGLVDAAPRMGFVVTASTTTQHPVLNARTFTTLDHLTAGRIGWNIVTSDNQQALVRLLGRVGVTPHDERYARAAEFVDLSLRLWEEAWDDGALVADKARRVFAEPAGVHRIVHDGRYFRVDGLFGAAPSPQRTPTLFQAGTSTVGRAFAARYAECVFTQDREPARVAATVARLRAGAVRAGRPADSLTVVNGASFVLAPTAAEAARVRQELDETPSREATAALFLGWSGVDLGALDPTATLDDVATEVGQTTLDLWRSTDGTSPTVGQVLDSLAATFGGVRFTGTPEAVADEVESFVRATGVDGLLVENRIGGYAGYREFVERLLPVLRRRGIVPDRPRSGTLRQVLTGEDDLPAWHPGRAFRGAGGAARA